MLFIETCRDVVEQRFTYSERDELHPAQAPEIPANQAIAGRHDTGRRHNAVHLATGDLDRASVDQWAIGGRRQAQCPHREIQRRETKQPDAILGGRKQRRVVERVPQMSPGLVDQYRKHPTGGGGVARSE